MNARIAFAAALVAVLAGCATAQPGTTPSVAGWEPAAIPKAGRGASWMGKGLKQRDLLYVANLNGTVSVYQYWQHTLVGVLTDFEQPYGECADTNGNVYITDYPGEKIDEYAHGGKTRIAVLDDSPYNPNGCAVNPKTGDVAVANFGYYQPGNVAVYPHGGGTPRIYGGGASDHFTSCAYDDRGDLLAASAYGYSSFYSGAFYYLPKRGTQLFSIKLPGPTKYWEWGEVAGLAWDGAYWVVDAYQLYRYSINVGATYVDTVSRSGIGEGGPVWIYRKNLKSVGTQVVGADNAFQNNAVHYWKYPAGGSPFATITKGLDGPSGVTVSLGTK